MRRPITIWLGIAVLGPLLGWVSGAAYLLTLQPWNWHWRLEARVSFGVVLPALAGVWMSRIFLKRREAAYLLWVWSATLLGAATTYPAIADLWTGPSSGAVRVLSTIAKSFEESGYSTFAAKLEGGVTLHYDESISTLELNNETANLTWLPRTGALLAVAGREGKFATGTFDWQVPPIALGLSVPFWFLILWPPATKRYLVDSARPTDGRRWIQGMLADGRPLSVVAVFAYVRDVDFWRYSLVNLGVFGWSSPQTRIETAEGPLDVDLRDAWYPVDLKPTSMYPDFEEEGAYLRSVGWTKIERGSAPVLGATFTRPIPRTTHGTELWERPIPAGSTVEVCGWVEGGRVQGAGRKRPLQFFDLRTDPPDRGQGIDLLTMHCPNHGGFICGVFALLFTIGSFVAALIGTLTYRWPWL